MLDPQVPTDDRSARPRRTGLILAGGRARRFGGEKALAQLEGTPLIRHVADAVAPVVDELLVNCRREQRPALSAALEGVAHRFALDPDPDSGPVAGLRTGLAAANGEYAFVVGCDQPHLTPGLVERVFDRSRGESGGAPKVEDRLEPLGAVYRIRDGREACARTLAADSGRLMAVLERVDPIPVAVLAGFLADVDTRADLEAARARLRARRSARPNGTHHAPVPNS